MFHFYIQVVCVCMGFIKFLVMFVINKYDIFKFILTFRIFFAKVPITVYSVVNIV